MQSLGDSPPPLLQSLRHCGYPCCHVLNGWVSCPVRWSVLQLKYCHCSTVLQPVSFIWGCCLLCPVPVVNPQHTTGCKHQCPRCSECCCCLFVHCICGGVCLPESYFCSSFCLCQVPCCVCGFRSVWYCPLTHPRVLVSVLLSQNAHPALVPLRFSLCQTVSRSFVEPESLC